MIEKIKTLNLNILSEEDSNNILNEILQLNEEDRLNLLTSLVDDIQMSENFEIDNDFLNSVLFKTLFKNEILKNDLKNIFIKTIDENNELEKKTGHESNINYDELKKSVM